MVTKLKVLGVIPARLKSTRIPEKMLEDICGKTLIEWSVERTKQAKSLDALVVATDSERVAEVVRKLDVPVIMTDPELPTGTDRVAAAVGLFKEFEPDIVVNIWGDEPLFPASAIDDCVQLLLDDPELQVASVADKIHDESLLNEPSIVQVLTDLKNNVLCFSRAPIPFKYKDEPIDHYQIIGILAMRREFLKTFLQFSRTPLERREGIEQMRILENGYCMRIVKGDYGHLGVNMPDELTEVRALMKARLEKEG